MPTPRFTPPTGPGGDSGRRDDAARMVSRRMRGLVALAVAGTVCVGALAAQHSPHATSVATTSTAATSSTSSGTSAATSGQATLQSAASTPASSAGQTPVAASGGS